MTREEVVEELQYIHDSLVSCDLSYEALEIAIKTFSEDVVPTEFHDKCMQIEIEKRRNMIEVVRCKDCEFWQDDWIPNTGGDRGCHYCEMMDSFTEPLNYCGYGERREVEE